MTNHEEAEIYLLKQKVGKEILEIKLLDNDEIELR